jgi:predicted anti-sigma-YlaC factor YlaD
MHAVVMESLEEYLAGTLEPAELRVFEAHLSACGTCRREIYGIEDVSQLLVSLRVEEEEIFQPLPGFFAGVMERVSERKAVATFAGFFGLNLVFGRRLAFACLLTLAIAGGVLLSRETGYQGGPSPEAVLAQQNSPAFDGQPGADNMLVTLTDYEH